MIPSIRMRSTTYLTLMRKKSLLWTFVMVIRFSNNNKKLCAWRHDMPRPSPPSAGAVAPRAAERTAVPADGNVAAVSHAQHVPTLTAAAACA